MERMRIWLGASNDYQILRYVLAVLEKFVPSLSNIWVKIRKFHSIGGLTIYNPGSMLLNLQGAQ
jgi:hypothetical protein